MMVANSFNENLWQEIMELSGAMLYQGERNNWEMVTKFEFSRKKLLEKFFHAYDPIDNNVDLFIDISQLLEFNQKLLGMVKLEKDGCQSNINNMKKSKTALQAYQAMN